MHDRTKIFSAAAALALAAVAGCESPAWTRTLSDSFAAKSESEPHNEDWHRRQYQENRSRKSLHWLLAHRLQTGMTYKEVTRVLGDDGERETKDREILTQGGPYRVGDEGYSFGPDSEGQSVILYFRDDKLINFDPAEFRDGR